MSDGIEIRVDGLEKIQKSLEALAGPAKEKIIRNALRAGGTVMQAAIIANAPINPKLPGPKSTALPPGALQADVHLAVNKDKQSDVQVATIYFGKYTEHVARWVEWGHRLVHGGRFQNWGRRGKGKEIGDVEAHPFVRPAFEGNIDLVASAINASMREQLASTKKPEV